MKKKAQKVKVNDTLDHHTFKVVPTGDGSLYGWTEFDGDGNLVRNSEQTWPSHADAEKAIRSMRAPGIQVEVDAIHNINKDANNNVKLVLKKGEEDDRYAGMTPVKKGIEQHQAENTGTVNLQDPTQNPGGAKAASTAVEEAKASSKAKDKGKGK